MQGFRPPPPTEAQPQRGGKNADMICRTANQITQMSDASRQNPASRRLPALGRMLDIGGVDGRNPGGKQSLSQDRASVAR